MATHSNILAWRIPVDRGARGSPGHGAAGSQIRPKWLSTHTATNTSKDHENVPYITSVCHSQCPRDMQVATATEKRFWCRQRPRKKIEKLATTIILGTSWTKPKIFLVLNFFLFLKEGLSNHPCWFAIHLAWPTQIKLASYGLCWVKSACFPREQMMLRTQYRERDLRPLLAEVRNHSIGLHPSLFAGGTGDAPLCPGSGPCLSPWIHRPENKRVISHLVTWKTSPLPHP